MNIQTISAREILDSRAVPTVEVTVTLDNGAAGCAAVPSGASTGRHEACEKRDGGRRFGGKGVLAAVEAVNGPIQTALAGMRADRQRAIDARLIELDGTENKQALGANAMLAVSLACARAAANSLRLPLYRYLGGLPPRRLPRVMMNVLNGGAHAGNNVDIQEFMLVPREGLGPAEGVRMGAEIYLALKNAIRARGLSVSVGDEGGFAPDLDGDEEALILLEQASRDAGYQPGVDVFFALDVAASGWLDGEMYHLPKRDRFLDRDALIEYVQGLTQRHPVCSVEDALAEDDFAGFASLTKALSCQTVGDDLFVTNAARIEKGALMGSATAALIKPNQAGTLTETLDAVAAAQRAGMKVIISHRSGETADDLISDLAVAVGADALKAGAPARAERTAKYNRLMAIEREMGEERFFSQKG